MANKRTNREEESREKETRATGEWKNPALLPTPNDIDGYKFRYIRVSSLGHADVRNASKAFREGWVPVKAADHPELELGSADDRWPDGVEVGGLLLCKIPVETIRQRNEHYKNLNHRQKETVDHGFMNDETDSRMKKFNESKSRNEFRRG